MPAAILTLRRLSSTVEDDDRVEEGAGSSLDMMFAVQPHGHTKKERMFVMYAETMWMRVNAESARSSAVVLCRNVHLCAEERNRSEPKARGIFLTCVNMMGDEGGRERR